MFYLKEINYNFYKTLKTYIDNKCIGRIDFELDEYLKSPQIIMIFVDEFYRRNKIATNMILFLKNKYGLINWGGKSVEGEHLYNYLISNKLL